MAVEPLFKSFFQGGFECSCHRIPSGRRLDLISATRHDRFVMADYARLREQGISTARDGVRWHLVEAAAGRYDFSSVLPMIGAAARTGVEVIWDLCHFGWPDGLDVFGHEFIRCFAAYARAFAHVLANETDQTPYIAPINEISFLSWAGGDMAWLNPFARNRGHELKAQLVRASIEGMEAIRSALPGARFVQPEPVIHIVAERSRPQDRPQVEAYRTAQFQVWDMLSGRLYPQLGGAPKYLDIIGVNFYPANQWMHNKGPLHRTEEGYRPFREILCKVHARYGRPLFVSETGAENDERADWLNYVSREVRAAMQADVPVQGVCLYPILNHPGWDDDRHCHNGLWDYADGAGHREVYGPLATQLRFERAMTEQVRRVLPAGKVSAQVKLVSCMPSLGLADHAGTF